MGSAVAAWLGKDGITNDDLLLGAEACGKGELQTWAGYLKEIMKASQLGLSYIISFSV